jgi:mannose-1-phosphate guanylyltransferase
LLRIALDRGLGLTDPGQVIVVVKEAHRRWWGRELNDLADDNVLVQPADRGTGVAILHALVQICRYDPEAVVVVLPSDHDVAHEDILRGAALKAIDVVQTSRDETVLLGAAPTSQDADYGWIVPGPPRGDGTFSVRTFVEKPDPAACESVRQRGAMRNTFILAATAEGLCKRYVRAHPSLFKAFMWRVRWGHQDRSALQELHAMVPTLDFSRDLLERREWPLLVLPVPACGWADLGTPARLQAWARDRRRDHDARAPVIVIPDRGESVRVVTLRPPA